MIIRYLYEQPQEEPVNESANNSIELEEFIMTLGGNEQLELDENELSRGITNLINAANYGITMASKKYDETKGYPFFSYAQWWVCFYIFKALYPTFSRDELISKVREYHNWCKTNELL